MREYMKRYYQENKSKMKDNQTKQYKRKCGRGYKAPNSTDINYEVKTGNYIVSFN